MSKKIIAVFLLLTLFGCTKLEPKCSDSRGEILEKFNTLIDKNNSLIGLISQTYWFHNSSSKIQNLNFTNRKLSESEQTLSKSTEEKLNTNCNPSVDLSSLRLNLNNMINYVDNEITVIKEINKNKDAIIKNSGCLTNEECKQILVNVYNVETEKNISELKSKLGANK